MKENLEETEKVIDVSFSMLQAYAWELMKESHGDNILLWQEDSQPFHNEFMNGNFNDTGKPIDLWTWKDYEKVIFIR